MQALLEWLLERLMTLWPLTVVREWNFAVLLRCGKIKRELGAGVRLRVPFIDEVIQATRLECVVDLPTAAIELRDGVGVAVSANIAYRVASITANWRSVWSLEESLSRLAIGRIATQVRAMRSTQLKTKGAAIEKALMDDLNSAVGEWGVLVTRVHLTDCIKVRATRHYVEGIYPGVDEE